MGELRAWRAEVRQREAAQVAILDAAAEAGACPTIQDADELAHGAPARRED